MARGLIDRWVYRVNRGGRWPAAIHAELASERVLYETEGIPVRKTFSGHVPGFTTGVSVQPGYGAFAVTDRRIIGTRGNAKIVDVAYDIQCDGPVTLTLERDGLHILWDMDRVHPSCRGTMKLHYKQAITDADLARFPVIAITFWVDPVKVIRFTGRGRLPPDLKAR
jgi:hypothetical protein